MNVVEDALFWQGAVLWWDIGMGCRCEDVGKSWFLHPPKYMESFKETVFLTWCEIELEFITFFVEYLSKTTTY